MIVPWSCPRVRLVCQACRARVARRRSSCLVGPGWSAATRPGAVAALVAVLAAPVDARAQDRAVRAPAAPAVAASAVAAPTHPAALVLDRVTVIDVEHGRRLPDQRVVMAGNRIRALGSRAAVPLPPRARVIDARGRYLIPGLWDMHSHPTAYANSPAAASRQAGAIFRQLIASGITGVRDAGASVPLDTFRAWKREIAAGRRVAPRLIAATPAIEYSPTPQPGDYFRYITRPEEAGPLVDSVKAAGADMLKLHTLPRPLWFALAAAARRAGLPFGGHFSRESDSLPPTVDGLAASDSGARILDHRLWADVCGQGNDSLASLTRCAAAAARLRRNRTWITVFGGGSRAEGGGARLPDSVQQRALRFSNAEASERGKPWRPPGAAERRRLPSGAALAAAVPDSVWQGPDCQRARLRYAVDLPWMPGPDFPSGDIVGVPVVLLREVLCGVPPWWVLRAATLEPARALGLSDSLGTVAEGKVADLVLLEGDPLADIWQVTKIAAVVANGRYVDRAALDRLLTEAAAEWRRLRSLEQP